MLLILTGQVAFVIGYVGFWRLYAEQAGRWGKHALRLFCVGGILMAIGHVTAILIRPMWSERSKMAGTLRIVSQNELP